MTTSLHTIKAYAAPAAGEPLVPTTIERREVGAHDVLIEIKYAGICHSDIHTVHGDWGPQAYPLVVGHEIAGVVAEVGPAVTTYEVGDHVGVGCMVNSCGACTNCLAGDEQYCLNGAVFTYGSPDRDGTITQGGYSSHVVVDADIVLSIPENIDLAEAAPLLCAGITTYSPLVHWNAGPGTKVAVIGLGGLGHMAVKIAHAKGAEVTVLSQSLKKQEDGLRLGVGVAPDPFPVDGRLLSAGRRSFAASMIGGIAQTQEMLDFCGEHNLGADIEIISADQINEAYERVLASDVRYRFVIDTATL